MIRSYSSLFVIDDIDFFPGSLFLRHSIHLISSWGVTRCILKVFTTKLRAVTNIPHWKREISTNMSTSSFRLQAFFLIENVYCALFSRERLSPSLVYTYMAHREKINKNVNDRRPLYARSHIKVSEREKTANREVRNSITKLKMSISHWDEDEVCAAPMNWREKSN